MLFIRQPQSRAHSASNAACPKPPLCKGRCPAGAKGLSIPQSASLTACGPGRKHGLLPALAANSPPGCLFNASRPLRLTKCRRKAAVARLHAPAGAVHKGAFPNSIHNTKIRPMFVTIGRINCFMKPAAKSGAFFVKLRYCFRLCIPALHAYSTLCLRVPG